jgi:hypothetical protein
MTRLLKMPRAHVDSSRIDMLAGLSKCESLRMPPGFWANVWAAATMVVSNPPTTTSARICRFIPCPSLCSSQGATPCSVGSVRRKPRDPSDESQESLLVEPNVFHAPTVEQAVDHDREPLHPRLPAGRKPRVKDDRPYPVFRQFPFDLPDQSATLVLVRSIDCRSII